MAIGDTYASLSELKAYLSLSEQTGLDEQMQDALQTASREIERYTRRQFNRNPSVAARVYKPLNSRICYVDDFWTTTGFVVETDSSGDGTFETTWASTDYELYPLNGVMDSISGWPQYKVQACASRWFPRCTGFRDATVRVTANWGWQDVPAPIKQSCLILAAENFQLKDAPLGVAGMGDFGVIRVRNNQMALNKLAKYCRRRMLES